MSAVDIVLAVSLVFVFLVLLGVMREVAIIQASLSNPSHSHVTRIPNLIVERLPADLPEAIGLNNLSGGQGVHVLAVISTSCSLCLELVSSLTDAFTDGSLSTESISFLVSGDRESEVEAREIVRLLERSSARVYFDDSASLAAKCGVQMFPALLAVSTLDFDVIEARLGASGKDVAWVLTALGKNSSIATLTS